MLDIYFQKLEIKPNIPLQLNYKYYPSTIKKKNSMCKSTDESDEIRYKNEQELVKIVPQQNRIDQFFLHKPSNNQPNSDYYLRLQIPKLNFDQITILRNNC